MGVGRRARMTFLSDNGAGDQIDNFLYGVGAKILDQCWILHPWQVRVIEPHRENGAALRRICQ